MSSTLPKEIVLLGEQLQSLPGIGPKLSQRLALFLGLNGKTKASNLSDLLQNVVRNIRSCDICNNVTNSTTCTICADTQRDQTIVIIVEDSLDLYNIESSGEYRGLYHVLGGVLSPVNGVGPDDISIDLLIKRFSENINLTEVIFGLSPNLEGDATSLYIKHELSSIEREIAYTRLAKGIPVGSDLEFLSTQTLIDSVKSRTVF